VRTACRRRADERARGELAANAVDQVAGGDGDLLARFVVARRGASTTAPAWS
jgi:hypothetical protein